MSFGTSFSLSLKNLFTKKGRTMLTSFAGSIGIIGIALILSLSNGVSRYISNMEKSTLAAYPLQISSTGVDLASMMDPDTYTSASSGSSSPEGMVTVLDQEQCDAIKAAPADPADVCCMIHLKGFASLTGGLQAADQAQNAETSATTVQLVSVCFSVFIAVLLTYAGSIWQLSIATVLMYQAAWSALSIAVCALKHHN